MQVLWVRPNEEVVPYTPEKHYPFKFLCYEDEEGALFLILGGVERGNLGKGSPWNSLGGMYHEPLAEMYNRLRWKYYPDEMPPKPTTMRGAGNIKGHEVTGWKSEGFGFTTPEEVRPLILEALQMEERPPYYGW